MSVPEALLAYLEEAEHSLRAGLESYASLAPGRATPTAWSKLAVVLLQQESSARQRTWAEGLVAIAKAQAAQFPETLFWDFDHLAASLLRETQDIPTLQVLTARVVTLQSLYGRASAIAFRYSHDFTYGFDWARWAAKAPTERAQHGPFSPVFISYLEQRGQELLELIAQDDTQYPRLAPGVARNPFGFSRAPADEYRLLEAMAASDEIPLAAWQMEAVPRWEEPFSEWRRVRAAALGLMTPDHP